LRHSIWLAVFVASLCIQSGADAVAATLEPIGKFEQPIFVSSDPSEADRLLVVERRGSVVEVGQTGVRQLADISALVSCCESERGLLSIAPAADFGSSGRFYAAYTGTAAAGGQVGDVHVDSFRPDPQGGANLIREPILSVGHAQNPNHNGGQLQFGPDGHLYISLGDGGGGGDPLGSGQDTETLLGKILRIDPHPGEIPSYSVPAGNPFVGIAGLDEIWAYGLRNPWRFSFDRANGDMVIADVGQGAREEIDHMPSLGPGIVSGGGANYGWNCREGLIAFASAPAGCATLGGFTDPVFDYPHQDPGGGVAHGCSITGGYVVRDPSLGDLYGRYLYADFCVGELRSIQLPDVSGNRATGDRSEGLAVANPTSFGEDSCGRLYVASNAGSVYRFAGSAPAACSASTPASGSGLPAAQQRSRPRIRLRARKRGSTARIVAELTPCATAAGERVQLNRGGRRFAVRRLDRNCVARFLAQVDRRSTFRALLPGSELKSPRLAVAPLRLDR